MRAENGRRPYIEPPGPGPAIPLPREYAGVVRVVGVGVLGAVLAAGLAALGWTCVHDLAGPGAEAALIIHEADTLPTDIVAECVARALPTVVVGSLRTPRELIVAVHAGATSVVDSDLPILDLLDAVQRGLTGTVRPEGVIEALRARQRLHDQLDRLTQRERAVLSELSAGRAAAEIAGGQHVSLTTVRTHIRSILLKLDVSSQLAAVAAGRRGWRELNLSDHSAP